MSAKQFEGVMFAVVVLAVILFTVGAHCQEHRFFDRQNVASFAAVGTLRALDVHSTWRFRGKGYSEGTLTNSFVDNKPAFIGFSAGMTGAHIAGCWLLHKTRHHKLEHGLNWFHIGAMTPVVVGNYRLR